MLYVCYMFYALYAKLPDMEEERRAKVKGFLKNYEVSCVGGIGFMYISNLN